MSDHKHKHNEMPNINHILKVIKASGLKLTKQRKSIVYLLFSNGHRHVSAEVLHAEAIEKNIKVSLATVYNTLRSLYEIGLVNEIKMFSNSIFDTDCNEHAHILDERTGQMKNVFFDEEHLNKIKKECILDDNIKGIDIIFKMESKV